VSNSSVLSFLFRSPNRKKSHGLISRLDGGYGAVGINKFESNFHLQLINEVWHYQNVLSASETLQRAGRVGSRKAVQKLFTEIDAVVFSTGVSQKIKMAPSIFKNTVNIICWVALV
jgi:hypothetical protein